MKLCYITQQAPGGSGTGNTMATPLKRHGNTIATVAPLARWWCGTAQTCYSGVVIGYTLQSHQ